VLAKSHVVAAGPAPRPFPSGAPLKLSLDVDA